MLSPAEVAEHVGLSKSAIYRAINDGELAAVKLRGRLKVAPTAVDAWLEQNAVQAKPKDGPMFKPALHVVPPRPVQTGDLRFSKRVKALRA